LTFEKKIIAIDIHGQWQIKQNKVTKKNELIGISSQQSPSAFLSDLVIRSVFFFFYKESSKFWRVIIDSSFLK